MQPELPQDRPASPSDFTWYQSENDDKPMASHVPANTGCIQRARHGEKMAEALKFEKADKLSNLIKRLNAGVAPAHPRSVAPACKPWQVKKWQCINPNHIVVVSSDEDNTNYESTEVATEPEDSEAGCDTSEWPNKFEEVFSSNAKVHFFPIFYLHSDTEGYHV